MKGRKHGRWKQYLVRFVFGGCITVAAGLIAHNWGPAIGGLFLAFPTILPASLTFVQEDEQEDGRSRDESRDKAGWDAFGSGLGSLGLMGFALAICTLTTRTMPALAMIAAVFVWAAVSVGAWALCFRRVESD